MCSWLIKKYKKLLDLIRWAPLPGPGVKFAHARRC